MENIYIILVFMVYYIINKNKGEFTMILAVSTPKGGVGKSTLSYHLARMFGDTGKTLLIDIDPQGNSTKHLLGNEPLPEEHNIKRIFENRTVVPLKTDTIDLIGSNMKLSGLEKVTNFESYFILQTCIDSLKGYKHIIIDTPPNIGIFTGNALIAADSVVAPTDTSEDSMDGLDSLVKELLIIKKQNKDLKLLGIIINDFDNKTINDRDSEITLRDRFGERVFKTIISHTTNIKKARKQNKTIIEIDPRNRVSEEMINFYNELLRRASNAG